MAEVTTSRVAATPGVLDLYHAIGATVRTTGSRRGTHIAAEVILLVVYVLLRSTGADQSLIVDWAGLVLLSAIVSPVSGLVIIAAIAPFTEPFVVDRQIGAKSVLVAALAVGVAFRFIGNRFRPRPDVPIILASLVGVGTAIGVGLTWLRFDGAFAVKASQLWLAGIGGGMLILISAAWIARAGEIRPLVSAVVAGTIAGAVSLLDFASATAIREGPLVWTVRAARDPARLMGAIPSPNGMVALLVGPTAVLVATSLLGRDVRVRIAAAVATMPLFAALYLTYSRTAIIFAFFLAVICVWRLRRAAGVAVLIAGLALGVLLTPAYLKVRGESIGQDAAKPVSGQILIPSDRLRLQAWSAAARMWEAAPLTGHGFQSYAELGPRYGDDVLNAPHNEWLRLFAEEGIAVGLVGLAFLAATLRWLARDSTWLGAGILAGFVGWALAASFNNPFGYVQVNAIIFTIVGTGLARVAIGGRNDGSDGSRAGAGSVSREPAR